MAIRMKTERKKRVHAGPVVAGALKSFVERIERVETDQKASAQDKREIYDEAKGHGYDAKTLRWIIQERKVEASDRAERDALRDTYAHALSMAINAVSNGDMSLREAERTFGVPKTNIHRGLAVPHLSREMVADDIGQWLPPHDPETGEVVEADAKPATPSILPSKSAWQTVIAVRDAHEAAAEAAREAKREARRQAIARQSRLAALTDDDMPDLPPHLDRRAQVSA